MAKEKKIKKVNWKKISPTVKRVAKALEKLGKRVGKCNEEGIVNKKENESHIADALRYSLENPIIHCKRCGRRLKNPVAIKLGYGSACFKKIGIIKLENLF